MLLPNNKQQTKLFQYARLQYHANRMFLGLDILNVFPEISKQFIRDIPIFEYPVFENFVLNY